MTSQKEAENVFEGVQAIAKSALSGHVSNGSIFKIYELQTGACLHLFGTVWKEDEKI
jgi:hypothetical protein